MTLSRKGVAKNIPGSSSKIGGCVILFQGPPLPTNKDVENIRVLYH